MLDKSVVEKRVVEKLERSVGEDCCREECWRECCREGCCREVLQKSVGEKFERKVLQRRVGVVRSSEAQSLPTRLVKKLIYRVSKIGFGKCIFNFYGKGGPQSTVHVVEWAGSLAVPFIPVRCVSSVC